MNKKKTAVLFYKYNLRKTLRTVSFSVKLNLKQSFSDYSEGLIINRRIIQ